jgi:hypothetical protein
MILWNGDPANPFPFSPVHKALKFSTVFGTTFPYKPKVISPAFSPSIVTPILTLCVTVYLDN